MLPLARVRASKLATLLAPLCLVSVGASASEAAPTFEQILEAPDDIALNLAFARAEISAGRLVSAASAFERVLILQPDADSVRLDYLEILLRLDNRQDAEEQIRILADRRLDPAQLAALARYRAMLAKPPPAALSGFIGGDVGYLSDAFGVFNTQFRSPQGRSTETGMNWVAIGRVSTTWKLPPETLSAYAAVDGYSQGRLNGPDTGFQFAQGEAGLSGAGPGLSWRLGGVGRHVRLLHEPYLTELGATGALNFGLGQRWVLSGSGEAVRQAFDEPQIDALAATLGGGHDGGRYEAAVTLAYRPTPRQYLGATVGYETKSAPYKPFAYDAPYAELNYNLKLDQEASLSFFASARRVAYGGPDRVFLGGARREDTITTARVDLFAPLRSIFGAAQAPVALGNAAVHLALSYDRRDNGAPLADFESFGGQMLFVWRFGPQR